MSDLTILLVTKNRYDYLKRWLNFANLNNFESNIFIADGSSNQEYKKSKINLNNYLNLKIKYNKYSEDKSFTDMYNKVVDSLTQVKTKYCVWADDDDFFFEKGLNESIKFLKSNQDYSSCRKLTGDFAVIQSKGKASDLKYNKYGEVTNLCLHNYPVFSNQISFEDNDIFKRLEKYTLTKNFTWYDVHTTKHMLFLWKTIQKFNFQNILLTETALDFLNIISGKVKRFSNISDTLYLLRQYPSKESVAVNFRKEKGDVLEQFFDNTWSAEYNNFVSKISSLAQKNTGLDKKTCKKIIIKCFRNYYKNAVYNCFDTTKNKKNKVRMILLQFYKYFYKILLYKDKFMIKFLKKNKNYDYLIFKNFFN